MNSRFAVCGVLMDPDPGEAEKILRYPGLDLVEWRLDHYLKRYGPDDTLRVLEILSQAGRHPVIATNRPVREGGLFEGSEKARLQILGLAAEQGAEWIDLEGGVPEKEVERFKSTNSKLLISAHNFMETPDESALKRLAQRLAKKGGDAIKIVTYARSQEDNLRVLGLIPFAQREFGTGIVAFCMGPIGLWSRFFCLVLGSPWTYVQLPGQGASAPGQLTLEQMRKFLEAVNSEQ